VGSLEQTKTGNLIIEGVLRLGRFTTINAPSGTEGALYFNTTDNATKLYSNSAWGDLGGGGEPGQLPTYTTAQRDALSPSIGLMIYNTDYNQVQTYVGTAWSGISGSKDLAIECASAMDCASGFCVDGVCCDGSCANICEACNLVGTVGNCTVRPANDDGACAVCKTCDGVSTTVCKNYVNNTQDTGCNGTCTACQSGICGAATTGTDPGNQLADLTCSITSGSCANTTVFKMSASTNAHAELSGQVNYSYHACCSGVTGLGTSCSGNYDTVLKLYGTTNSHVEKSTQANYGNSVCLSLPVGTNLVCDYSSDCAILGSDYACVASISGDTNAHVSNCTDYSTKVCCANTCE